MRGLVLGAALALLPGAAAAQGNVRSIDETAADLAYRLCPQFLAGRITLTDTQFADRGFGTKIETVRGTRFGQIQIVKAKLDDGQVVFGGAPGKACGVTVTGASRDVTLTTLRKNMPSMGLDFQPAAGPPPAPPPEVVVETFRASAGNQFIYLQLLRSEIPEPTVAAQLFAMDQ